MYQKLNKSFFPFEDCWNLLKNQQKRLQYIPKEKQRKWSVVAASSPHTPDLTSQQLGDGVLRGTFEDLERPIDKKAEKEKQKAKIDTNENIVMLLGIMKAENKNS